MLPDETVVWLNSNSTIKYLPEFDDDVRRVLLAGESYFEVAKDESRPFIVETSDFTVEVLGTEFNVSAYEDVEFSDATLVKGQIVIENKRNKKEIELLPGQKVRISKSNNEMLVSEVDVNNEILWKSEFITFEQERIIHIISKLEYIYGVKIALEHDPNEIYTYSGAVTRKGSIDEVLASLQNVIPFSFMKTKDGYLVIL
jgi:ferric-dicitrate binding protein FerR (iron transport regulator)